MKEVTGLARPSGKRYIVTSVTGYSAYSHSPATSYSVVDQVYGQEVAKFYVPSRSGASSDQHRLRSATLEALRLNLLDEQDAPGVEGPVIFPVDEADGTRYVLCRPGKPPVSAAWPQPLLDICPEAQRVCR
jgi:hypothetical protein